MMFWHDVYPARKRVSFLVGNVHPESKIQKKLWLKIFGSIRNAYKKNPSLPIRSTRVYTQTGFLRICTNFTYKMRMRTYAILGNVRIAYIFFQFFAYGQTQKKMYPKNTNLDKILDATVECPLFLESVRHKPQTGPGSHHQPYQSRLSQTETQVTKDRRVLHESE